MPRSGTRNFNDPDDFQTNFRDGHLGLVFTDPGTFKARQTWVGLAHVHLVRTEEWLPRIAFVSLSRTRVFISFPMTSGSRPTWGGTQLEYGDIVLHKVGGRAHERTSRQNSSGYISLSSEHLASLSCQVTGVELMAPLRTRILRPSKSAAGDLLELCTKACNLAEKRPEILAHSEVSRAIDQEILFCLLKSLTTGREIGNSVASARHAEIMTKFEAAVTEHLDRPIQMPQLCSKIGVAERTLRECCSEALGMGPQKYLRLRRLNRVNSILRRANPDTTSVGNVALRHQFSELGRFAVNYRQVFGETPSATLVGRR